MTEPNPDFQDLPIDATCESAASSGHVDPTPPGDSQPTDGAMEQTIVFDQVVAQSSSASSASGSVGGREKYAAERLVGGYRLQRLLGAGGMGRVYEAEDASGRKVAVKLLSPQLASSSDAIERFKLEGVIASAINHPNCVFVHRADEDQGIPFIQVRGRRCSETIGKRGHARTGARSFQAILDAYRFPPRTCTIDYRIRRNSPNPATFDGLCDRLFSTHCSCWRSDDFVHGMGFTSLHADFRLMHLRHYCCNLLFCVGSHDGGFARQNHASIAFASSRHGFKTHGEADCDQGGRLRATFQLN